MKKNAVSKKKPSVVLRFRHVVLIVAILGGAILLPLTAVTKQVYITNSSIEHKKLVDSLRVLRRDAERLRLTADGLSDAGRIETAAKKLGLDYPSSDRIVILPPASKSGISPFREWEFLAIMKRSFFRDKSEI